MVEKIIGGILDVQQEHNVHFRRTQQLVLFPEPTLCFHDPEY